MDQLINHLEMERNRLQGTDGAGGSLAAAAVGAPSGGAGAASGGGGGGGAGPSRVSRGGLSIPFNISTLPPPATQTPDTIARSRGFPSHAAVISPLLVGREFRDPNFVIPNVDSFRYFLVATHGKLTGSAGDLPETYIVPTNTMLVKTGCGPACGSLVLADMFHRYLHYYFMDGVRPYTFSKFLGIDKDYTKDKPLETLSYSTPGDVTYNKNLTLSSADLVNEHFAHVIGVTMISHEGSTLTLQDTEKTNRIRDAIIGSRLTEEAVVKLINAEYPVIPGGVIKGNLIVLMSCSAGPDIPGACLRSTSLAARNTAYALTRYAGAAIQRPRILPVFDRPLDTYISTSLTEVAGNISTVGSRIGVTAGSVNPVELMEAEREIAEIYRVELIRELTRAIDIASRGVEDSASKALLEELMSQIDANRSGYVDARTRAFEAAEIARGLGVDISQYERDLVEAKAVVDSARAAARSRLGMCGRAGSWLCRLFGSDQRGSGRRRTRNYRRVQRRQRQNTRKTRIRAR